MILTPFYTITPKNQVNYGTFFTPPVPQNREYPASSHQLTPEGLTNHQSRAGGSQKMIFLVIFLLTVV
jgi:hypothetical protein